MPIKTILGIHAATKGLMLPFTAKDELMVMNRIYAILKASPIPMFSPMPPFTFRAEREAPIMVRIKAENIEA